MGGFGTWELGSMYPDRFAAIAPMCGGGRPELARRMKNLPIWVFHGEADGAVPLAQRRNGRCPQEGRQRRKIHQLPRRRPRLLDAILQQPRVVHMVPLPQATGESGGGRGREEGKVILAGKSETRKPKSEKNPNAPNPNSDIGISDLIRISGFEFRISAFHKYRPLRFPPRFIVHPCDHSTH